MKKKIFLFFISLFAFIGLTAFSSTQLNQKVQASYVSRYNLKSYTIPAKYRGTWHTNKSYSLTYKKWSKDKSKFVLRVTKRYIKGSGWGEPNNYPTYKNKGNLESKLPYTCHITLVGHTKNGIYFCHPTTNRTYISRKGNKLILQADDWKRVLYR